MGILSRKDGFNASPDSLKQEFLNLVEQAGNKGYCELENNDDGAVCVFTHEQCNFVYQSLVDYEGVTYSEISTIGSQGDFINVNKRVFTVNGEQTTGYDGLMLSNEGEAKELSGFDSEVIYKNCLISMKDIYKSQATEGQDGSAAIDEAPEA